jgi:hypothetical protein
VAAFDASGQRCPPLRPRSGWRSRKSSFQPKSRVGAYFLAAAANKSPHTRPTPQFVSVEPGKLV